MPLTYFNGAYLSVAEYKIAELRDHKPSLLLLNVRKKLLQYLSSLRRSMQNLTDITVVLVCELILT